MEKTITPLSIKIMYWLTQVAYWMYLFVAAAMIIGCIVVILGYTPENLNLHVQTPFEFELNETGEFILDSETYEAGLSEASGKINIFKTPEFIAKRIAVVIMLVIAIFFFIIWSFRKFIINVYQGIYFRMDNIKYLKHMVWWILALWIATELYFAAISHWVIPKLSFESITIKGSPDYSDGILLVALCIWVLTHIFQKGIQLQEQEKLTI